MVDSLSNFKRQLYMLLEKLWVYASYISQESETSLNKPVAPIWVTGEGFAQGKFKIPFIEMLISQQDEFQNRHNVTVQEVLENSGDKAWEDLSSR